MRGIRTWLTVGWLATTWLAAPTRAGTFATDDPRRPVPRNARVRPGIDTEGYPRIGRRQRLAIAGEVVSSSFRAVVHGPIDSAAQVFGRGAERLGVRGRELSSWAGSARAADHVGRAGDGCIDGPFGSPPFPAALTLLPTSESAVRELRSLIDGASRRVDLMMYGWDDDPTGREVAEALAAAGRRGVRVRLLVDRGAFLIHNPAAAQGRPTFLDRLKAAPNVVVIEPENPFLRFDHRKLAVVDGRAVWAGGMILTEIARRRWENLAYRAEGPVVGQFAALFEDRWREVGGAAEPPVLANRSPGDPPVNATVRLVRTDLRDRSLKNAVYHAVDHSRRRIYLENPYFSDDLLADKLVAARRRGVDVRVVLTLRGNVATLNRYVVLTANRLLRGGVRVYLAPGMTHVKAMSVDGGWCYLGSGNFDELSLRHNREVGLAVQSAAVASALDAAIFRPDLAAAEELTGPLPPPEHGPLLRLFALWF